MIKMFKLHANNNCSSCHENLTDPRRLPCKHMLCLHCVQKLVEKAGRKYSLSCPVCRKFFAIPGSSIQPKYVEDKYKCTIEKIPGNNVLLHGGKIMGMAILEEKLFVICKSPPDVIFKHDISAGIDSTKAVELNIPDMVLPRGMASNKLRRCLYITDWSDMFKGRLWRYKYQKGRDTSGASVVATLDTQPFGVSVSPRNDMVLVTCATPANVFVKRGWIYVYRDTLDEFQHVKNVLLEHLEIPRHTVLTAASKYLVCHGWTLMSHGVTSFQDAADGKVAKTAFYGAEKGGGKGEIEMNRPLSMALDEDGLVLVVDYNNHRIQLLTEDLHMIRHLVTKEEHGIELPRHVCLSSKTGRMFVAQEDGVVRVFDARI